MRRPRPATALHTLLAASLGLTACDGQTRGANKAAAARPAEKKQAEPPGPTRPDDDGPTVARTFALALHRVAIRRGPLTLHRLSDGEIALSGGLLLARARDGALAQDPAWLAGLPTADPAAGWRIHSLGGRGDDLWLTTHRTAGDATEHQVHHRRGGAWVSHETGPEGHGAFYMDYTIWPEGHGIALAVAPGEAPRLDVLAEDGARPAAQRFEASGLTGTPRPTALAGLASGELFVALAADEGRMTGLLRWGPREETAGFAPLPAVESRVPPQVAVLVEGDGHEVLIGDSIEIDDKQVPYIARFDGTLWRVLDPPPAEGAVASLVESAGPVIWAVIRAPAGSQGSDSLWRLQAGGDWDAWERVELGAVTLAEDAEGGFAWDEVAGAWTATPGAATEVAYTPAPATIGRDAAGELWLVVQLLEPDGTRSSRWAALRTKPAERPLALLDDAQVLAAQQDLLPRRAPKAGDATCPKVYVQLNTLADGAEAFAPELTAALTEKPVPGALLGEVRSQGQRQVGLLLSLADYEAHKAAIAALGARLKLKPRPSCGFPPLVRGWRP